MARRKSTVAADAAAEIRAGMPKETKAVRKFTVTGTNIKGSDGVKRGPGEEILLTKKLAGHYHKLGYIFIPMDDIFGEDDADNAADAVEEDT